MKRLITLCTSLFVLTGLHAQTAEVFRSEFVPFDTRDDATELLRGNIAHYEEYKPQLIQREGAVTTVGQVVEIPLALTDRDVYLHLENVGSAYTLLVNDAVVAEVEDDRTPREFLISPHVKPGRNAVMLDLRPSKTPQLQADKPVARPQYANSYLIFQHRLHIDDYTIALVPDSTGNFAWLNLDVVVSNSYNGTESISAGYDIYDPKGKLLDYGLREVTVPGGSRDTLHFKRPIYGAASNQWDEAKQPLYKVTLYTKRNGILWEYIPLQIGYGRTEFRDGRFYRFGLELLLRPKRYNAAADEKTTAAEMKKLKAANINTLLPEYPQPHWFYTLCDRMGFYVIDCAAIDAPTARDDRSVGGTPSNDPQLVGEYVSRVKAMYYRSRNHTSIIAFMLGYESGNGYNMYKAYEWLKSVEHEKPVIYFDADGEWNSDIADEDALQPVRISRY